MEHDLIRESIQIFQQVITHGQNGLFQMYQIWIVIDHSYLLGMPQMVYEEYIRQMERYSFVELVQMEGQMIDFLLSI